MTCLIFAESSFDKSAVSGDGAIGLMQILVQNEEHWEKHKDPSLSLEIGTSHLRSLLDEFNGEIFKAIASYNCGINCMKNKKKLPRETLLFTEKVLNCYYEIWLRTPDVSFPFNFCEK